MSHLRPLTPDPEANDFNLALVDTSVHIYRAPESEVLRGFEASIDYHDDSGITSIGVVRGWVGWLIEEANLPDEGDMIAEDAHRLAVTAARIIDAYLDDLDDLDDLDIIDTVLLIKLIHIDEQWRGHRLTGHIIGDLMALLRLPSENTVVALQPEPQAADGGPMEYGPVRDEAMSKLQSAYRTSGFEPWDDSDVWWRPL